MHALESESTGLKSMYRNVGCDGVVDGDKRIVIAWSGRDGFSCELAVQQVNQQRPLCK